MYTKAKVKEKNGWPSPWCIQICSNSLSEKCVTQCAVKKDCSGFEPKKNLRIEELPFISLADARLMSGAEKFYSMWLEGKVIKEELLGVNRRPAPKRYEVTVHPNGDEDE
jgi:hypothetical protein